MRFGSAISYNANLHVTIFPPITDPPGVGTGGAEGYPFQVGMFTSIGMHLYSLAIA